MSQLNLFGKQPAEKTGDELRAEGIAKVSMRGAFWLEQIRDVARDISKKRGMVSADDLRTYADNHKMQPHHRNAWGAVFAEQGWQLLGRKKSARKSNHGREIKLWAWKGVA